MKKSSSLVVLWSCRLPRIVGVVGGKKGKIDFASNTSNVRSIYQTTELPDYKLYSARFFFVNDLMIRS